jgi:hypothetical protein
MPYWRQWGCRYTIRAGRNSPDKEFRYLRTVRVTAAVYWGFHSKREPLLLTYQHRAGVRPNTSSYDFAESCVFIKQSQPPDMLHQMSGRLCLPLIWHLFSRSYEVILPSSFNMVLSKP